MQRGAGWSWGPRSAGKAWGIGVGVHGYAGGEDESWRSERRDLELGNYPRDGAVRGQAEQSRAA